MYSGPRETTPTVTKGELEPLSTASLTAEQIAGIYRGLRRGREMTGNEPGAADFYYGEMEMRRHAARRQVPRLPTTEWWILSVYWLTCGYCLRAWRTVMVLLFVFAGSTILLFSFGFDDQQSRKLVESPGLDAKRTRECCTGGACLS